MPLNLSHILTVVLSTRRAKEVSLANLRIHRNSTLLNQIHVTQTRLGKFHLCNYLACSRLLRRMFFIRVIATLIMFYHINYNIVVVLIVKISTELVFSSCLYLKELL